VFLYSGSANVRLGTPTVPASARAGVRFTSTGSISSPQAVGSKISVGFYQLSGGRWVLRRTAKGVFSSSTKWGITTSVPAGSWRVRAFFGSAVSGYSRTITVR
jgi:hypothetical protein